MSKHNGDPEQNGSPSFEVNLFTKMMAFHQQILARLREESLDEEQQRLVLDQLNTLVQDEIEDMQQTLDLNMPKRLESVSKQINQYIDELVESD